MEIRPKKLLQHKQEVSERGTRARLRFGSLSCFQLEIK